MLSDVTDATSLETPAQESSTQENPIPELVSAVTSVAETAKVISSLHQSCDWLLQNFDTRKTARAGEVEALNNTKAVLAGSDDSLQCRAKPRDDEHE